DRAARARDRRPGRAPAQHGRRAARLRGGLWGGVLVQHRALRRADSAVRRGGRRGRDLGGDDPRGCAALLGRARAPRPAWLHLAAEIRRSAMSASAAVGFARESADGPTRRISAGRTEWMRLAALADFRDEWRDLSERALEPNVFYDPGFALAAAPVFGADAGAVLVWSKTAPQRLI